MLLRLKTGLLAVCTLAASLGLNSNLQAQALLVIDHETLNAMMGESWDPDRMAASSGRLTLGDQGEIKIDPIKFSRIPDICQLIIFDSESPWNDVCGGGLTLSGNSVRFEGDRNALIEAAKLNQANYADICKITDCGSWFPKCKDGEWFNPAKGRCDNPAAFDICKDVPLKDCGRIPLTAKIPDILGGGCRDAKCLPDDFFGSRPIWPPIGADLEERIRATQGTIINVVEANLQEAAQNLAANEFLIMAR